MADKNKFFDVYTVAVLILIFLAAGYFALYFLWSIKSPAAGQGDNLGQFKLVNAQAVNLINNLTVCGDWPLTAVNLSVDRGNPFSHKSSTLPQMAAISTVSCSAPQ